MRSLRLLFLVSPRNNLYLTDFSNRVFVGEIARDFDFCGGKIIKPASIYYLQINQILALRKVSHDEREDYGEDRFLLTGRAAGGTLAVVYTECGERIRIVSAREAADYERRNYYRTAQEDRQQACADAGGRRGEGPTRAGAPATAQRCRQP